MSAPVVQGWCPGALRPMMSGDGLVVRVRAPLGRLTQAQAGEIAALATRYGNGLIDLSNRANLQLRGVREQTHAPLIAVLGALGLIDADIAQEARRNIVMTPFWTGNDAAPRLARTLSAALAAPDAPALPGKFGFAVDDGPTPVLRAVSTDIRIERLGAGFLVYGSGAQTGAMTDEAGAVPAALALAHWFAASGGISNGRGRMKALIARGAMLPEVFRQHDVPPAPAYAPAPGLCGEGALLGLAFGQMQAPTLGALAALGALRLTPWRQVLVEGLTTLPVLPDIITDPADPLLRVIACTGAPGCVQALAETRELARELAPLIPYTGLLHVSGCAKGCAHPDPAPLTLVATDRGFDLIRDGHCTAAPSLTGLAPHSIARVF